MNANFNRAATSATKSEAVLGAVKKHLKGEMDSVGRGSGAVDAMAAVLEARIALSELLHAESPNHIIFTSGSTESLNILIGGLLSLKQPHIVISCFEHNAVARPVNFLAEKGLARMSIIEPTVKSLRRALESTPEPPVVILTHASNVFGNLLPVSELFSLAKTYGAYTILDSSQTLGHLPVHMTEIIDAVAFTGHKGLRGLPGSGGFAIGSRLADVLMPWKHGGTGSISDSLSMPDFLPDKFEAGTPNMLGILALGAAAEDTKKHLPEIAHRERMLFRRLFETLQTLPVQIHGFSSNPNEIFRWNGIDENSDPLSEQVPVLSITVEGYDSALLADDLDRQYGIKTRTGLHCAPLAHRYANTFPEGTLRLSINSDNTVEEIDYLGQALKTLLR